MLRSSTEFVGIYRCSLQSDKKTTGDDEFRDAVDVLYCQSALRIYGSCVNVITFTPIKLGYFPMPFFTKLSGTIPRRKAQTPACHSGDPNSSPNQSLWDLWLTMRHWDRFFSQYFGVPPPDLSFH
jgi:hypothetical protein